MKLTMLCIYILHIFFCKLFDFYSVDRMIACNTKMSRLKLFALLAMVSATALGLRGRIIVPYGFVMLSCLWFHNRCTS